VASNDTDRRTAQHELPMADSAEQRGALAEVKESLEGLDDRTRRKGLLLVTALVTQGSMLGVRSDPSMSSRSIDPRTDSASWRMPARTCHLISGMWSVGQRRPRSQMTGRSRETA
jgi:hypothetical protein